ncbi:MAG TPA: hypothetical protein VFV99_20335 [Kofleriaceae bacterium]|nr:hypothetical protein [Kofleriaceae bacterium]
MRRFSGDGGRFDGQSPTIRISDAIEGNRLVQLVAHESSHLSMYQLTRGASATEPFRFFDEGYSDLVGKMIAGENMANHKRSSLAIANREVKTKGVGFETMQHWSDYAGNVPSPKQAYAYPVGSSFVYFVIDSFGEKKLFDFFRDIGETRDLDTSLRNIFGLTAVEVEQRWKDYVASSALEPPAITEMSPSNESSNVPVDIAELLVKFSVPMMMHNVCVDAVRRHRRLLHERLVERRQDSCRQDGRQAAAGDHLQARAEPWQARLSANERGWDSLAHDTMGFHHEQADVKRADRSIRERIGGGGGSRTTWDNLSRRVLARFFETNDPSGSRRFLPVSRSLAARVAACWRLAPRLVRTPDVAFMCLHHVRVRALG